MKERMKVYNLFELRNGDRFYKNGQASKRVWQVEIVQLDLHNQISSVTCLDPNKPIKGGHEQRVFKQNYEVVFLRSAKDK